MDPWSRETLKEIVELTRENNKILKGIRNSQRWASILRALYWIMIVVSAVGGYYALKPYLSSLTNVYTENNSLLNSVKGISADTTYQNAKDFLDQLNQQ